MSLYAYCLVEDAPRALARVAGVDGAEPFALVSGSIHAVVSRLGPGRIEPTRERVLAHQRVLDCILEESTPLPFRFGTVVDEAGLESFIAARADRLAGLLARARGSVEMTVKIFLPPPAPPRPVPAGSGAGAGRRFLEARRAALAAAEDREGEAGALQSWLEAGLGDIVMEAAATLDPGKPVLRLAHRIERGSIEPYLDRLRRLVGSRSELKCLISGPWPPYTLVDRESTSPHPEPGSVDRGTTEH